MGYWIVDGDNRFDDLDDLCDYLFDPDSYDDDAAYDEWLDDVYSDQESNINGRTFPPSEILYSCDEDLYASLKHDWQQSTSESDLDYYYSDLNRMDDGEQMYVRYFDVTYHEDDNEEDEDNDDADVDGYEEEAEEDKEENIIVKTLMDYFQQLN